MIAECMREDNNLRRKVGRRSALKTTGALFSVSMIAGCIGDSSADGQNGSSDDDNTQSNNESSGEGIDDLDEPITLREASLLDANHFLRQATLIEWTSAVTERTDGMIQFDHNPGNVLGPNYLDLIRSGAVDLCTISAGHFSETAPLTLAMSGAFPGSIEEMPYLDQAFWKMHDGVFKETVWDANNIKPLAGGHTVPGNIQTVGTKIEEIDDFSGLLFRDQGSVAGDEFELLGAQATDVDFADAYQALERGVIDGLDFAIPAIGPVSFDEVLDYSTTNVAKASPAQYQCINLDTFNSLPTEVQEIMIEEAEKTRKDYFRLSHEQQQQDIETLSETMEMYELEDHVLEEMNERWQETRGIWINRVDGGEQIVEEFDREFENVIDNPLW